MGLSQEEVAAFEEYFYHIMAARGSGEHALRHLLAPFARAKHPLEGRLHDLKVHTVTCLLASASLPESSLQRQSNDGQAALWTSLRGKGNEADNCRGNAL